MKKTLRGLRNLEKLFAEHGMTGFDFVSMNIDYFTHPVSVMLRESPVKVCLFTAVKASRLTDAVERGADLVGSQYLDVEYMHRLTDPAR